MADGGSHADIVVVTIGDGADAQGEAARGPVA